MLSDLRFVIRALARNRGFTSVTVLTLALGIGSAASIFSVVDWVLFRANQFPDDVYLVGGQGEDRPFTPVRYEFMTRAYEAETRAFRAFAKAANRQGNVVIGDLPVDAAWLGVSPGFLPMLGIVPEKGRGFLPDEGGEGRDQVVIVSHQFWRRHLGGRDDALGKSILVDNAVCTVVGILGEGQAFPAYLYRGVYRPLTYRADPGQPWSNQFFFLAQLAEGVTREQAEAALRKAKVEVPTQMSAYFGKERATLSSMGELNRYARPEVFWMMLGAVGFLYAIACLNASNLMLVRLLGLRRELSIRLALGAGRWRVARLLVLESAVLAVLSGLVALLVANWIFPLLLSSVGGTAFGSRNWAGWTLGWRIIGVMGLLTLVTSLVMAFIAAVRVLRADINPGLKDGGAALGEGRGLARLRGVLVVLQAAFAVVLLVGAGLMIRTFANIQRIDLGFEPAGLIKVFVGHPPSFPRGGDAWEARLHRLRAIQAELERVPGVQAVGFGQDVLLPGWYQPGHTLLSADDRPVKAAMVGFGNGFEKVSGIKLRRGRWHTQSQGNEVLINESLARALWPDGTDPVGQHVRLQGKNPSAGPDWKGWLVVGVVADIRGTVRDAPGNYLFGPEAWGSVGFNCFILRTGTEEGQADAVRRRLYAFDPQIVVYQTLPVSAHRDQQLWAERIANAVLKVLAGIALLLTVVGVFSVLAYTVDRRLGEFGVRMALGATSRDLALLVMRRGVLLAVTGILFGLGGALMLTRFLQSLLYGVAGGDPTVLAVVAVLLLATSVLACLLPARRAARVDVAHLLRSE